MHGPDAAGASDDRRGGRAGQLGAQVTLGLILALALIFLRAKIERAWIKARLTVVPGKEAAGGE